jgi:predicted component of type VI protein secretion system
MILKQNGLFVAEVKHAWGKIVGSKQGLWTYVNPNGTSGTLANPYLQVRSTHFDWKKWCNDHLIELNKISGRERLVKDWEPLEYVVLFPQIPEGSEINVGDFPVQVVGLSKFRMALVMQTTPVSPAFTKDELRAIPTLLKLTQWHIEPPPEPSDEPPERLKKTLRLSGHDDFHPPIVRMLVARGHEFSQPVFYLDKDRIVVGRDPDSDLVINHESVSRKHAEIRQENERWIVRDLHSQNGTFVSYGGDPGLERRVERYNALKNGSIVRFGYVAYTVLLEKSK